MKSLTRAYNAGWRAGMATPRFIKMPSGLKHIVTPDCPLKGRLARMWWEDGRIDGMRERIISNPLYLKGSTMEKQPARKSRDYLGIILFVGLFVIFKVL